MKQILTLLIFAIPVFSFAQTKPLAPPAKPDTVITADKINPNAKHFLVTLKDNPLEQGVLLNGKREGVWRFYYDAGMLKKMQEFHDGKLNGFSVSFDRSSYLMGDENYTDDKLDGLVIQYHNGGKIKQLCHYKMGVVDGKKIINYDDGSHQEESEWKNGVKDGVTIWYYQGNTKAAEYHYTNGKENGKTILFNTKGKPVKEGNFVNDKEEGDWKIYDEAGDNVIKIITYKNGMVQKEKEIKPVEVKK